MCFSPHVCIPITFSEERRKKSVNNTGQSKNNTNGFSEKLKGPQRILGLCLGAERDKRHPLI
jgi:hypothetical protein